MLPSDSRGDPPQQQPVSINPFDAVIATATVSAGGAHAGTISQGTLPGVGASSSDAAALTALQGDVLNTTPGVQPISPSRVSHPSSVNSSPIPTRRPGNNTIGMPSPIPVDFNRGSNNVVAPEMPGLRETEGVFLGLEQLERQQAELERRRQVQSSASSTPSTRSPAPRRQPPYDEQQNDVTLTPFQSFPNPAAPSGSDAFVDDDDENTEPSSTGGGSDNREGAIGNNSQTDHAQSGSSFGRIIQNTKMRLITAIGHERPLDADDEADVPDGAVIAGYLQKLGRNGKWQKRWFETDGQWLSYYKTSQRIKRLAKLDLEKVGRIAMSESDNTGCAFTIQVSDRPYHLRAENKSSCKDWVIQLNRVKEARMQQGNIELVKHAPLRDLLDRHESDDYNARIVVVANRQRTRAVDQESWEEVVGVTPNATVESEVSAMTGPTALSPHPRLTHVVFASWKKRRTVFSTMATKLLVWARSLRQLTCSEIDNEPVILGLDQHVHPPGHDEVPNRSKRSSNTTSSTKTAIRRTDNRPRPDVSPSSNHSIASTTTSDPRELA